MNNFRARFLLIILCFALGLMMLGTHPLALAQTGVLPTSPSWSKLGTQADADLGYVVTQAGDVNRDDFDDVLVSAMRYDNGQTDEGKVELYYGSLTGLASTPAWSVESNTPSALLGHAMASAGDVNNDGYGDVIIGSIDYSPGGAAYLYLGSASGLSTTPDWSYVESEPGARFGGAVASAGDVNKDGYDDVIIGAANYWQYSKPEELYYYWGAAFLFYGNSTGLSATPAWAVNSDQSGSQFGFAVAGGDLNDDGYIDIAVSAIDYDNGQTNEGRVFIYYGSVSGLSTTSSAVIEPNQAEADFGFDLTTGDINGDRITDLLVGGPGYTNTETSEGAVYVYRGVKQGVPFPTTPYQILESNKVNGRLGESLDASGNVNGDGYRDLAIGAPGAANEMIGEGAVFVSLGSTAGLTDYWEWTGEVNQAGARFGNSVGWGGDINDDGSSDLLAGARFYDVNALTDAGAVYAYYGQSFTNGLPPVAGDDTLTVLEDTVGTVAVLSNDSDPDNDPITLQSVSKPDYGQAVALPDWSIEYTPPYNYSGTDQFTYTIRDSHNLVDTGRVTVTITPVNDPPVLTPITDQAVSPGQSVSLIAVADDPDDNPITFSLTAAPAGATLNASTGAFSWAVPANQAAGVHTVTIRATDNGSPALYAEESFTITVRQTADLSITKTTASQPVSGNTLVYSINVKNAGPHAATEVGVSDTLSAGLTYRSVNGGPAWDCLYVSATRLINCSRSTSFASGSNSTITLEADINQVSGSLSNTASVGASSTDLVVGNNSATNTVTVIPLGLSVATQWTSLSEKAGDVPLTVSLSNPSLLPVSVNYATEADSAAAPSDYTAVSGTLTFAPGETSKQVTITIVNDTKNETPSESFLFRLSTPVNSTISGTNPLRLTIADDDALPVVQFAQSYSSLVSEDAANAKVDVQLSAASTRTVTVAYATQNGTAIAGSDYTTTSGTLTFPAGETVQTITIPLVNNTSIENEETFTVVIANPTNATLAGVQGANVHSIGVRDDDAPVIGFSPRFVTVDESAGEARVIVSLSKASSQAASLNYSVFGYTATSGLDFLITNPSGTLTIPAGSLTAEIPIQIINDTLYEGVLEEIQVRLSNPSGCSLNLAQAFQSSTDRIVGAVYIADNEPVPGSPNLDLMVDAIEVTQGIQNLLNQVTLVSGKPTYVRLHVHSAQGEWPSEAELEVSRFNESTGEWESEVLQPVNPTSVISVKEEPIRARLNDAFLFLIPSQWTVPGTLRLTGIVNPDGVPVEVDGDNNDLMTEVTFQSPPPMNLVLYRMLWCKRGTGYPSFISWCVLPMIPAFEISTQIVNNTIERFRNSFDGILQNDLEIRPGDLIPPPMSQPLSWALYPTMSEAWSKLMSQRQLNILLGVDEPDVRYYGLMQMYDSDNDSLAAAHAFWIDEAAISLTGTRTQQNAQRAIAHTFGAQDFSTCQCISSVTTGSLAYYGFDPSSRSILPPTTKELMSQEACGGSRFGPATWNYLANWNFISVLKEVGPQLTELSVTPSEGSQALLVRGVFSDGDLSDLYILNVPDAQPQNTPGSGEYALVLRDVTQAELYRQAFMPIDNAFSEWLPVNPNAAYLEVEGPGGALLKSIQAGSASPVVTITEPAFPEGAQPLTGETVTVRWTGSDPDGDEMTYALMFSPNNGQTWQTVQTNLTNTEYTVPLASLSNATPGHFAVWATDGIHGAQAASDPFIIVNRSPTVEITAPEQGTVLSVGQVLALSGSATDPDGILHAAQITWSSSINGVLGNGASLAVSQLSLGEHIITLTANDGAGGISRDQIAITITNGINPLPDTSLILEPGELTFDDSSPTTQTVYLSNGNPAWQIQWQASTTATWLSLSATSGSTPGAVTLTYHPVGLDQGNYTTKVTFTSPDLPDVTLELTVNAIVSELMEAKIYLPIVVR